MAVRIFKTKWFNRWAKGEGIPDSALIQAAEEVAGGKFEADLGGCLFKKRLARPNEGKRGGYRTIVGYKKPHSARIIFLYAFAKNSKGNISAKEEKVLSITAGGLLSASDQVIERVLADGEIYEVNNDE
jgi:hypothetical protein